MKTKPFAPIFCLAAAMLLGFTLSAATIPGGTSISIRLIDSINSDSTGVGERFRGSLEEPIVVDGKKIAKRGAGASVEVGRVEQAGRITGKEELALRLVSVEIDGHNVALSTSYAEVSGKSKGKKTAKRSGFGAAIGGIAGGVVGGAKGAVIGAGAGAGAGAVYSATRGEKIHLPSETVLVFSLQTAASF